MISGIISISALNPEIGASPTIPTLAKPKVKQYLELSCQREDVVDVIDRSIYSIEGGLNSNQVYIILSQSTTKT